ncbi:hypothetical protein GAY28_10680 [Azospirillum brasilense]|nr:hypothetical protein [Azospirillum brasilense]
MNKAEEMRMAEERRKRCRKCMLGSTCVKRKDGRALALHPSDIAGGKYEVSSVSHWTYWQGNIHSRVAVVAPYWGTDFQLMRQEGCNDSTNATTRNVAALLSLKGLNITPPEEKQRANEVYVTNAMLCMLAEDPASGHAPLAQENEIWKAIKNCNEHLALALKSVRSPVVISLGTLAYKAVLLAFGRKAMYADFSTLEEVVQKGPIKLLNGVTLYPQFMPGGRSLKSRPLEQLERDWQTIPFLG